MLHADASLAQRIERYLSQSALSYVAAKRRLAPDAGAAELEVAGGSAVYGGKQSPPRLSRAQGLGLGAPVTSREVQAVTAFYEARRMSADVVVCPHAHASLPAQLSSAGFAPCGFENVLFLELGGRSPTPARAAAGPVEIRRVTSDADALRWSVVVRQGFGEVHVNSEEAVAVDAPVRASATVSWYLAWLRGEVAGGSALEVREGLAFLFASSTLPASRRQGVHRALLEARLAAAREAGADVAAVITSPGSASQRNFERAGFQVAYTALVLRRPFPASPRG